MTPGRVARIGVLSSLLVFQWYSGRLVWRPGEEGSAGFLSGVLVTSNASAALSIYDNASTNSGTLIGYVPSTATS